MTGNPAPPVAAQDAPRTIPGHLAFLAEAQPASAHDVKIGGGRRAGFAAVRDLQAAHAGKLAYQPI